MTNWHGGGTIPKPNQIIKNKIKIKNKKRKEKIFKPAHLNLFQTHPIRGVCSPPDCHPHLCLSNNSRILSLKETNK